VQLLGIFGHPIAHSLSPKMHQAALQATGLASEYVYLPFDVVSQDLSLAVGALRALHARGVNVTIPHKEAVIPLLDQLDCQAGAIGAVNVIVNDRGWLTGYNTDGIGFIRALKEEGGVDPGGKKILVFGAGGAARAVCAALATSGSAEILVVNRTIDRAESVAEMVKSLGTQAAALPFSSGKLREEVEKADIIVNTTSVGLYPAGESLLTAYQGCLKRRHLVCDIIYHPRETLMLSQAKTYGCSTLSGMGMLLFQGVEAFKLWTGVEAPVEVMRKALEENLCVNGDK